MHEFIPEGKEDEFAYYVFDAGTFVSKYSAYRVTDELVQESLPKGYKLISWIAWGACDWKAKMVKTK